MLDGDPRRVGHRLTMGRKSRGRGPVAGMGVRYATTGHCQCDPVGVRFKVNRPPSGGGQADVRAEHARHVEQAEGPALPGLTRAQRDALLSTDPVAGWLQAGRAVTLESLGRLGLIAAIGPGGRWLPTVEGARVIGLLRRVYRAA